MTVLKRYNSGTSSWEAIVAADKGLSAFRNILINGDFRVAQRGTSFTSTTTPANNDDTYLLDRWTLLSDGNDAVDVTQSTEAPTGGLYSIGLDVETANKKFGIIQIVEQQNIIGVQGQTLSLSFKARTTGSSISDVKAVVLSWTGTADTVTSDVVSTWNASGTVPTWVANWTAENTPANLNVTNSWATYSLTALMDTASIKNVAVFIWCDDATTTLADFLYITDVQLEIAGTATSFERRNTGQELAMCQRYFEKSYNISTSPGTNTSLGVVYVCGSSDSFSNAVYTLKFSVLKRTTPTITFYTISGTSGNWQYARSGVGDTNTAGSWTTDWRGESGGLIFFGVGAAWTNCLIKGHWVAESEL